MNATQKVGNVHIWKITAFLFFFLSVPPLLRVFVLISLGIFNFSFQFFFLQLDREKMRKKVSKNVGPTMNLKSLNCYGRSRKNLKNVDGVHSHNKFLLLKIYFCIFYLLNWKNMYSKPFFHSKEKKWYTFISSEVCIHQMKSVSILFCPKGFINQI